MTINYKDKELNIKYSFRALMIYENINGKSFNPTGISDVITFFYSVLVASNRDEQINFDDFMDWLDDNPYVVTEFAEWLTAEVERQSGLVKPSVSEQRNDEVDEKN